MTTTATLASMIRTAETGEQWANITVVEALAARHQLTTEDVTVVHFDDRGDVSAIECGADQNGLTCTILNFAI